MVGTLYQHPQCSGTSVIPGAGVAASSMVWLQAGVTLLDS